jgi:hypothetical protein
MRHVTTIASVIFAALAATACGSVLGFIAGVNTSNADAQPAQNPFDGGQITYRAPARDSDLQNVSERDCTTWPLHDEWVVRAGPDQLCVDAVMTYSVAPAYILSPGTAPHWSFFGDGDKSVVIQAQSRGNQKIGECTSGSKTYTVWHRAVTGCAHNDGVLTASSSKLELRQMDGVVKYDLAAWKFQ